jgi:hypothetical protein
MGEASNRFALSKPSALNHSQPLWIEFVVKSNPQSATSVSQHSSEKKAEEPGHKSDTSKPKISTIHAAMLLPDGSRLRVEREAGMR